MRRRQRDDTVRPNDWVEPMPVGNCYPDSGADGDPDSDAANSDADGDADRGADSGTANSDADGDGGAANRGGDSSAVTPRRLTATRL